MKRVGIGHLVCTVALLVLAGLCGTVFADQNPRRILIVDSYHRGYAWSDGIRDGIREVLGLTDSVTDLMVGGDDLLARVVFMDTKRNPDPLWSRDAARRALDVLESWRPDVVIVSDDNAVRDLVVPHLLGRELPVIYCGVNWDAGVYGLPAANVTGMVEQEQVPDLLAVLRPLAAGDRVGLLVLDSTTGRRDADILRDHFGLDLTVRLVDDYAAWKDAFVAIQDEVDILLLKQNITGAAGWDPVDAVAFTRRNTRIPTGTTAGGVMRCTLVSFIKNPCEQGRWAAQAALDVLAGAAPSEIPPAVNKESRVLLNMTLAEQLGFRFPMELIERADFLEESWAP